MIVPASFNFPHTGKLLSLSFILFAGWFADAPVPVAEYPQLAFAGLVSFFGSLSAAVPFLLDLLRIPADTFQLFLATGVINSRVGSLVAAVHTLTVALLATCAITGHLRWRRTRVVSYAGITVALVVVGAGRHASAVRHHAVTVLLEGCGAGVDAAAEQPSRGNAGNDPVAGAAHFPSASRDHRRPRCAACRLPAGRAAVRVRQPGRSVSGIRRRARARSGARARGDARVRPARTRQPGGATGCRLLRPGDVGYRRDHGAGAGPAALRLVSR